MRSVAFVTHELMPDISDDDRLAADVLQERGVEVCAAAWDDSGVEWTQFDNVVIRSTWDDYLKPDRYAEWLLGCASMNGRFWNPPSAVLANLDKRYLCELAKQGIEVVPTAVQSAGDGDVLSEILERCGWDEVVIKPAISASAWGTWRTSVAAAREDQARFAAQVANRDVLIQPYMSEVASEGEWSLFFSQDGTAIRF